MAQLYSYNPEQIGRRRLPDNKAYRANLKSESSLVQSALFDLMPSNYPKDSNSNLGIFLNTIAREAARQQDSVKLINDDKVFTQTRVQYLQQILGERLFLNTQLAPFTKEDIGYRNFLLAIKDAYLQGSKKSVIETLINHFTKLEVNIKELYLEARKPNSAIGIVDTHKMIIELFVDDLIASGNSISDIVSNLSFFVNLVKPAHVLYDTRLIWTEEIIINKIHDLIFGDTGGGCVPKYIYTPFNEKVYLALKIQVVDPSTTGSDIYEIGSILPEDLIIFLTNDTKVIVEPGSTGTQIYGANGRRVFFSSLKIGDKIRLVYLNIPGDFNFYYLPPDLVDNYASRFYKDVYRKGAFQEFVVKEMDSKGRFPRQIATTPTTMCDRWVQDALQPMYEDMRRVCDQRTENLKTYKITLASHMWYPRFPLDGVDTSNERPLIGDLFSYTMPYAPLTNGLGGPAAPTAISVFKDSTSLAAAVQIVDSSAAYVSLFQEPSYWDTTGQKAPVIGEELKFNYFYLADNTDHTASTTFVYGINYWLLPGAPISNGLGTDYLALPSDVSLYVDGTEIPDAVTDLKPIEGFVTVEAQKDFWLASPLGRTPNVGDVFQFNYYQSGSTRYAMLFDDPSRVFDDDVVFDGEDRVPIPVNLPAQIGYKFRADLLHHAAVLNSADTLLLNNYQKPAKRASIINRQDTLNHYNYFFSPDFLVDPDTNIILDDQYLEKDTSAVLVLNEGTPTFQQTYAYQPGMIQQKKLQDIRKNHSLLMYCDLLLKEIKTGDSEIHLSSLCDNESPRFSVRFHDEFEGLSECNEWMLFDVGDTTQSIATIPSGIISIINLRIPSKKLEDNFVLREMGSSNIASVSYSFFNTDNTFQLPSTLRLQGFSGDFPSLPVMKNATTLADSSDVGVSVDGTSVVGAISSFNPTTGYTTLYPQADSTIIENITVTADQLQQRYVKLSTVPVNPENVVVSILYGPTQVYGYDYLVSENIVFLEASLRGNLNPGDTLVITYQKSVLIDRTIKFTYNIKSTSTVTVIDPTRSRVMDEDYVFPYFCYDGYDKEVSFFDREYINMLSDNGKGIKYTYLNKDTYQIEEHIFSGPVFETYSIHEDELSAIESFPNALVKIANPLKQLDPLNILSNYDFLNDSAVRIRKKTVRELLPDRTFRSFKIIEAMPV